MKRIGVLTAVLSISAALVAGPVLAQGTSGQGNTPSAPGTTQKGGGSQPAANTNAPALSGRYHGLAWRVYGPNQMRMTPGQSVGNDELHLALANGAKLLGIKWQNGRVIIGFRSSQPLSALVQYHTRELLGEGFKQAGGSAAQGLRFTRSDDTIVLTVTRQGANAYRALLDLTGVKGDTSHDVNPNQAGTKGNGANAAGSTSGQAATGGNAGAKTTGGNTTAGAAGGAATGGNTGGTQAGAGNSSTGMVGSANSTTKLPGQTTSGTGAGTGTGNTTSGDGSGAAGNVSGGSNTASATGSSGTAGGNAGSASGTGTTAGSAGGSTGGNGAASGGATTAGGNTAGVNTAGAKSGGNTTNVIPAVPGANTSTGKPDTTPGTTVKVGPATGTAATGTSDNKADQNYEKAVTAKSGNLTLNVLPVGSATAANTSNNAFTLVPPKGATKATVNIDGAKVFLGYFSTQSIADQFKYFDEQFTKQGFKRVGGTDAGANTGTGTGTTTNDTTDMKATYRRGNNGDVTFELQQFGDPNGYRVIADFGKLADSLK